jgi:hypothetical protein
MRNKCTDSLGITGSDHHLDFSSNCSQDEGSSRWRSMTQIHHSSLRSGVMNLFFFAVG